MAFEKRLLYVGKDEYIMCRQAILVGTFVVTKYMVTIYVIYSSLRLFLYLIYGF